MLHWIVEWCYFFILCGVLFCVKWKNLNSMKYMKKITLMIFVSLLVNDIIAQITEKAFYDFCQCDYIFAIRDTTKNRSSLLLVDNNKSVEVIHYKGKVVNFKEYHFPSRKKTKYEYTLLNADTFYFTEYDTLQSKLARGNVYFDKKQARSDSTFLRFDHDTYEEYIDTTFRHFYQPVKHGHWYEEYGNDQIQGHYKHGKKHGIWEKCNFQAQSCKELEFVADSLIREKELNLVKRENVTNEIIELLTKDVLSTGQEKGIHYIGTFGRPIQRLKFHKNGTVKGYNHHRSSLYDWTYDDDTKTIKMNEITFKIIWMREGHIELKSIQ